MVAQKISAMPTATLPLNPADTLFVMQQGELRKVTFEDAYASFQPTAVVTTPQVNSTTTPAEITELTMLLQTGSYVIEGSIVYRSAATGVGLQMYLDAGTPANVSRCSMTWWYQSTGTLAASGVADQSTIAAQLIEGKSQNVIGVGGGATQGVDTANTDMLAEVNAIMVVTGPTTIKLMFNASAGGTNVSIMEGSCLIPSGVFA